MKRCFNCLALLLVLTLPGEARAESFAVVVHPQNPTQELSKSELSELFMKRKDAWSHGPRVEPVYLQPANSVRAQFSEEVLGKPEQAVRAFWLQQLYSGKEVPPVELGSDAAVIEFVRDRPGAIGYVSASTPLAGVRRISISD